MGHCGSGDMASLCGVCPHCGGSAPVDPPSDDNNCCNQCAGHPHCSPQSGHCHEDKPSDKDYYLDCGSSNGGSVPAPSPGSSNSCLCVFDIDRTLTAKQGTANQCPGTHETQYFDDAYDSGKAVLSAFAAAGIQSTFCGHCYLGI